ncbi:DUF192 domain-containing protein [Mangrovimonas spongiae]|uniref:DUF192 domain-containing protein n=1 Tax=Mangrovimonas spongiae TaxID=2494697 RepID=A0A428K2J3_9FLAO|nr:DUF192 domain-containing protein [Mangrovimonas spongiae]RSK40603.1 DUF192 domain-containing protein [Mangrovimonas spongiae]
MKKYLLPAIIVGTMFSYSCKEEDAKNIKPTEVSFKKEGELTIFKATSDSIITQLDIEIAKTSYETQTGLMYRSSMKKNRGMLFIFDDVSPRYFYMKNTRIPLDIIYLNENLSIVSIQKNAKPLDESSLPSKVPAKYVLEVNAGLSDVWQLTEGDKITFSELSE